MLRGGTRSNTLGFQLGGQQNEFIMKKPGEIIYLRGQDDESDANHDDHVELRWPNVRHVVAVADGWERDHHKVTGLEQIEVAVAGPLEMLHAAHATDTNGKWWPSRGNCVFQKGKKTDLVNTRQRSVADRTISCCERADWERCIARCKSFCTEESIIMQICFFDEHNKIKKWGTKFNSQTCFRGPVWPASSWGRREWTGDATASRTSVDQWESVNNLVWKRRNFRLVIPWKCREWCWPIPGWSRTKWFAAKCCPARSESSLYLGLFNVQTFTL